MQLIAINHLKALLKIHLCYFIFTSIFFEIWFTCTAEWTDKHLW